MCQPFGHGCVLCQEHHAPFSLSSHLLLVVSKFNIKQHLYKIENIFNLNACGELGSILKYHFI